VEFGLNHAPLYHLLQLRFVRKHYSETIVTNAYKLSKPTLSNSDITFEMLKAPSVT
jgi:hypothetical protein